MKKILRLTEGDLHNFIKESIKNVLSELDWKTYASAARKMMSLGQTTLIQHINGIGLMISEMLLVTHLTKNMG